MKDVRVPILSLDYDQSLGFPNILNYQEVRKTVEEAVKAERERCAKVAESIRDGWAKDNEAAWIAAQEIARRIIGGM